MNATNDNTKVCPYCQQRVGKLPPHLPCEGVEEKEEFVG